MADWVRVAAQADCPPGSGIEIVAEGRIIALFNVEGTFYAIDGICAHQGGPLGKGVLHGSTATCPWHGWQYDVGTGRHSLSPVTQRTFPVRLDGDDVLIGLDADDHTARD
jgi:nitrite reductase/ring-hydroxylating ferredoxin subunit